MKRILILLCALLPLEAWAQVFTFTDSHPARKEGQMLSISDISTKPKTPRLKSFCIDPQTGEVVEPQSQKPSLSAKSDRGSLYIVDKFGNETIVAEGSRNLTYGGVVSRNEFAFEQGIFWSPDSTALAFYENDESNVDLYPLLSIKDQKADIIWDKYPMNGTASEHLRLGIYHLDSETTSWISCDDWDDEGYLTNVCWSPSSQYIFIQVLDRSQHEMHLNMYNAADGSLVRTLLTEKNDAWVEPYDVLHFLGSDDRFIYSSASRDGFKNLYICDLEGNIRSLTAVNADVSYVAWDGTYVYYTSAEVSPVENHLFRIEVFENKVRPTIQKIKLGAPQQLTAEPGWHDIKMADSAAFYLDRYSSYNIPGVVQVCQTDGTVEDVLDIADDPLMYYHTGEVRFGTVPSADGMYDNNFRLFLPKDFDPEKKYPAIVYVYGGPHSQMVRNQWLGRVRLLELYLAQHGFIVYVQDNRGTSNRGLSYEQAINGCCGAREAADQMMGVRALMDLPYVDSERIGVHGWSYGGFMTITMMTRYPDVFKVGVAGGPVIDWKWYEIMYGERYMDTEETNPEGFAQSSLIARAGDLKGRLLICQGLLDDTVLPLNSLCFIQACIENNVPVDFFPYPLSAHNVAGKWREHLNAKIADYFEKYL